MRVWLRVAPTAFLISALLFCVDGCKNPGSPDTTNSNSTESAPPGQTDPSDPANANLAPVSNSSDNTGVPAGAMASSPQTARQYQTYSSNQDPYANQQSSSTDYDDYAEGETPSEYAPDPPPPMPTYQQPPCPGDGYVWTPGYWGYANSQGYYWVPGAWTMAPYAGALWTPGWWGFTNERYGWHPGYWGRHIGYYGGIAYGNGYDGFGYQGGYWKGDHFEVNRYDNSVNTSAVDYVYNYRVNRYNTSRVSYNGGQGGLQARPRPEEVEALHERHNPPMTAQAQLAEKARGDRQSFANANHGRPQMPAANHPLEADHNVPPPQPVRYTPPASRTGNPPWQSGARPPQESPQVPYHDVGPERMVPRLENSQPPQRQQGAQPKQVPYHDVGPERMVPRLQNSQPPQRQQGAQPKQVPYHDVGPERMVPRLQNSQPPQRQQGAQPKQVPYHDVGPERMVPRLQNPQSPAARGGPVPAPGNPQAQPRQPEQRPAPQQRQQEQRSQPQRPQGSQPKRPQQERSRG